MGEAHGAGWPAIDSHLRLELLPDHCWQMRELRLRRESGGKHSMLVSLLI